MAATMAADTPPVQYQVFLVSSVILGNLKGRPVIENARPMVSPEPASGAIAGRFGRRIREVVRLIEVFDFRILRTKRFHPSNGLNGSRGFPFPEALITSMLRVPLESVAIAQPRIMEETHEIQALA